MCKTCGKFVEKKCVMLKTCVKVWGKVCGKSCGKLPLFKTDRKEKTKDRKIKRKVPKEKQ
jgi:hypothetical protein